MPAWFRPLLFCLVALLVATALVSCGGVARNPLPDTLTDQAAADGMTGIRFWGDQVPPDINEMIKEKVAQVRTSRPKMFKPGARPQIDFLSISGGGSDGAFGAGLLVGWTAAGTRPKFEIVTGISTGALSAPFAFLGPKYDHALKEVYTKYSTHDLVTKRPIRGLVGGDSLAGNKRLAGVIAHYVTPSFMAEVAAEHNTGRRLLIGTTNLDAQRPVIWDMGQIANSGHPDALNLFRNVLLASAAIPGVFPPVFMKVQADGKTYDEMHVDGGTTQQVFLLPNHLLIGKHQGSLKIRPRRRVYIIRNGRVTPEHKVVKAGTLSIAARSVSTLIKYQGIGDLYRIHEFSRKNKVGFKLAYIPASFPDSSKEAFDTVYMNKLFNLAFEQARNGYKWKSQPP